MQVNTEVEVEGAEEAANLLGYNMESPISLLNEDEPIDFSLVYALHTFVATLDGQVCVLKGDSLELLDDSNSYWWLVKCIKTEEVGYIPAENIETPFERLARLNRQRNVVVAQASEIDYDPRNIIVKTSKKGITFAAEPLIIWTDGEVEDGYYMDGDAISGEEVVPNSRPSVKLEIGKAFRRIFHKKDTRKGTQSPSETDNTEMIIPTPDIAEENIEPISVLRIYAGNVDLKATFKTVAITKDMIVSELLEAALRRFRVPDANPEEYYISVLHMDSQEKRVNEDELISVLIDSLRNKSLPGVGDFSKISRAVMTKGQISSVKVNDDNIIKMIINKKLNLFEKNNHLVRIFMYDESDPTGKIRYYKTVGVDSTATVEQIVEVAAKKFKVGNNPGYQFTLHSLFKGHELERKPDENIREILQMAQGSVHDIDFVLRREWIAPGSEPKSLSESNNSGNKESDLDGVNNFRVNYLEEPKQDGQIATSAAPVGVETSGSLPSTFNPKNPDINSRNSSLQSFRYQKPLPAVDLVSELDNKGEIVSINSVATKLSPPPRQASMPSNHSPIQQPFLISDSNTLAGSKTNLEFQDEYLAEIMKENMDFERLEYLEAILKSQPKNDTPTNSSSDAYLLSDPSKRISAYNDSGLARILSNRKSQTSIRKSSLTSSNNDDKTPRINSISSSIDLNSVYNDLENEIEETTIELINKNKCATPAVLEAVPDSLTSDRLKEAEQMLNSMQKDLDKILSKTVKLYRVSETV